MRKSVLLSGAVAPLFALGQEIIPAPVVPANTTTVALLPDTTTLPPETTAINTPSSNILFTSSVPPLIETSSTEIAVELSTSDTFLGTPTSEVVIEPTTVASTESSELIPTSDSTTLPVPTTLTSATLPDTTTSEAFIETSTTAAIETTTAATTESSVAIASSDSTTLPEPTSETSALEDPTSATITEAPTQTEDVPAVQTDEAKKAADDAYNLMGIYVNNPTQENAQKAKDSTDNALGLVTGVGGGVPGFGGLISSLGGAAGSLVNAVSTPGAATAAAVSSAMTQVKQDIDETKKDDDKDDDKTTDEDEPSSTENSASSTTEESSTTAESTTTTETTTTTSEYPSPTFAYDRVTEAAGGSDDIASALAESQIPELGCMSEFKLPITACALQTGGGLDETTTTATSAETTTTTMEESTTVTSVESTSVPSTLFTVTRSTDLTSDSTTTELASSSTVIESSETLSSETTATTETLATTTDSETTTDTTETTTTAESTTETTSEAPERTYYPCLNHGGPNVATPYCQCSTTTGGQTFFATATLISGQCAEYSTFPSEIPTVITEVQPPVTQGPVAEPVTLTEDGVVLSYPSRVYSYGEVYTGIKVTMTYGAGTPVTLSTPVPTQTDANNKGSSQCHSVDDACQRAYEQFEDDTIYTDYVSRYSRIKSGIIVAATFGQAGCTAQFKCDDYGIGMSGRLIKDAVAYMKENNGVSKCGTAYLSNSCSITLNYCTNCHHDG